MCDDSEWAAVELAALEALKSGMVHQWGEGSGEELPSWAIGAQTCCHWKICENIGANLCSVVHFLFQICISN